MSLLSRPAFISFYERKCFSYLYHTQDSLVAACLFAGLWCVFLLWQWKCQRKFSVRKSLRKTAGKSTQNDEKPQPSKKHRKSKIMNKEESNSYSSVTKTSLPNNRSLLVESTNSKCVKCIYLVGISIHNVCNTQSHDQNLDKCSMKSQWSFKPASWKGDDKLLLTLVCYMWIY